MYLAHLQQWIGPLIATLLLDLLRREMPGARVHRPAMPPNTECR